MIHHAIVFGPVGAIVYWDEEGCHALRLDETYELKGCDELVSTLMAGNIEAQRLDTAQLSRANLRSILLYWFTNHQALRANLGALEESLGFETSIACVRRAEFFFEKDRSALHFVACRMLGCSPPSVSVLERAVDIAPEPNYRHYNWLIRLTRRTRGGN
jgi:hypothetical protein